MLESLTLTNFKSFARQELRLAPFTLLTGLNSSGKSSVLQSLALLRQSYESGDLAPVGDRDAGLLLNDELVQLGTGRDVRHESYDDTGPHVALTLRGTERRHSGPRSTSRRPTTSSCSRTATGRARTPTSNRRRCCRLCSGRASST